MNVKKWLVAACFTAAVSGGQIFAATQAADFKLQSIDGKTVQLSELKGKVVFLDFWASWCPPCRQSIPMVEKLAETFSTDQNVVVLGINVENDAATAKKFAAAKGIKYPILVGNETVERAYRVSGIPAFFIVGPNGEIAAQYVGFQAGMDKEWAGKITALLSSAPKNAEPAKKQGKSK